jgi:hypothetical protein
MLRIMTTDATPAAKVAAQEADVARLRHELELAEAVLRGMKAMLPAEATPPAPAKTQQDVAWDRGLRQLAKSMSSAQPAKGRQPGAISQQWRNTLCRLLITRPDGFADDEAAAAAISEGLPNIRPKDAADRLGSYLAHKYVERLPNGEWRITDLFAQKYPNAMRRQREALQIEAPSSEPEEAQF